MINTSWKITLVLSSELSTSLLRVAGDIQKLTYYRFSKWKEIFKIELCWTLQFVNLGLVLTLKVNSIDSESRFIYLTRTTRYKNFQQRCYFECVTFVLDVEKFGRDYVEIMWIIFWKRNLFLARFPDKPTVNFPAFFNPDHWFFLIKMLRPHNPADWRI